MNRSTRLLVIALGLVGYGIYRGLYIPAMLSGPSVPLLLIGFLLPVAANRPLAAIRKVPLPVLGVLARDLVGMMAREQHMQLSG